MKTTLVKAFFVHALVFASAGVFANTKNGETPASPKEEKVLMPQNLASFNAVYGRNFFDLSWNTVSVNGFDHFEIERSIDGVKFEKIGEVKATDASKVSYSFHDTKMTGTLTHNNDFYYRLKQVDGGGNASYSKVLIARVYNTRKLASVNVTPDPVENDIIVNVQLKENSYVAMKITDASGNTVVHESAHGDSGFNSYTIKGTNQFSPGLYTLEVIVNSRERMTMKLQKM